MGCSYKDIVADGRRLPSLKEGGQMIVTFIMVLIGWIIFRAENISQLAGIGSKLISSDGFFNLYGSGLRADIFVFIGFMQIVEWLQLLDCSVIVLYELVSIISLLHGCGWPIVPLSSLSISNSDR